MQEQNELMQAARERADRTLDAAIGELRAAAREIGRRHEIPENISGLSVEELLGRMSYIPSMARELRRVAGQELAKRGIAAHMEARSPTLPAGPSGAEISTPEPNDPDGRFTGNPSQIPAAVPVGMDVGDLSGVTVQAVKALREGGIRTVGDIVGVPDEYLLKMPGIAEKSLQQIRQAVAKASEK